MMPPTPSANENFEQWLAAYEVTHPRPEGVSTPFTYDDMFSAWVGGAIFAANKFFNPSLPPTILPDIFRVRDDDDPTPD